MQKQSTLASPSPLRETLWNIHVHAHNGIYTCTCTQWYIYMHMYACMSSKQKKQRKSAEQDSCSFIPVCKQNLCPFFCLSPIQHSQKMIIISGVVSSSTLIMTIICKGRACVLRTWNKCYYTCTPKFVTCYFYCFYSVQ